MICEKKRPLRRVGQRSDEQEIADSAEFGLSSVERSGRHIGVTFARLSQARYESSHDVRFVGLSSKAYVAPGGQKFWFGITHSHHEFLKEADAAWLAFECGSPQKIVLFPFAKFQPFYREPQAN